MHTTSLVDAVRRYPYGTKVARFAEDVLDMARALDPARHLENRRTPHASVESKLGVASVQADPLCL